MSVSFVFPDSPGLVWGGLIFSLPLLTPFLTLKRDPLCFLSGECVGFPPPAGSGSSFLLPYTELCGTFHTSYSGTGLAREWDTDVPRGSTLTALELGLYDFKECSDFLHLVDYSLDPA